MGVVKWLKPPDDNDKLIFHGYPPWVLNFLTALAGRTGWLYDQPKAV